MRVFSDRLKGEAKRARVPLALYVAVGAVALLSFYVLFHNLTGVLPWKSYRDVHVAVSDAKGIVPGQQEVRAAGVRVGVVKDVDLRDGKPVLTLALDSDYGKIYHDARLRVRPVTPLQDEYVSIEDPGQKSAGVLKSDEVLPAARSQAPVDVSRVLDIFDTSTRSRLSTLLDEMGRGLADRGEAMRETFVQLAPFFKVANDLGDALASRREHLKSAMHNITLLTNTLADRDQQLAGLVVNGNRTFAATAGARSDLGAMLAELPGTLQTLNSGFAQVRTMEDQLDPALSSLQPVADALKGGLVALRQFSGDATPALAALRTPVRRLRPLAVQLKPAAASAGRVITKLNPQAPDLVKLVDLTTPCLPQVGKFFWRTISISKTGDDSGMTARADLQIGIQQADFFSQKDTLTMRKLMACYDGKVTP